MAWRAAARSASLVRISLLQRKRKFQAQSSISTVVHFLNSLSWTALNIAHAMRWQLLQECSALSFPIPAHISLQKCSLLDYAMASQVSLAVPRKVNF